MFFYFVRHGQTEANRLEVLAGSGLDHPLTEVGHRQAETLAQAIRQHIHHPLHRVIASNMRRAQQTAEYLSRQLGMTLELNAEFREWHLGEWEGKIFAEFGHLLLGSGEPKQGESRQSFYQRIDKAWKSIYSDEQPYLIVAHGGVWLALQDLLQIPRFKISNCHLVRVRTEEDAWQAEILNATGE